MNDYDYDLIDNKYKNNNSKYTDGEIMAKIAYGSANKYLEKFNNILNEKYKCDNVYLSKNKQSKFLYDIESIQLEKELNNNELMIIAELEEEKKNYNSRLKYFLENNSAEIDLCFDNIILNEILWNGNIKSKVTIDNKNNKNLSIYDIYLKIEKTNGEFTQKDILKFVDVEFMLNISGKEVAKKDFFTTCFFELVEENEIVIEPNILFLKVFNFENLKYGIPYYFLQNNSIEINSNNLKKELHSEYKIEVILSGKNLSSLNINSIDLENNSFEQIIVNCCIESSKEKISSGQFFKLLNIEHPVSLLMFFLFENLIDDSCDFIDYNSELVSIPDINSIIISLNGQEMWWDSCELIKINFMDIKLCIICIDPQLKDYNKFCSYIKNELDLTTLKSINFSRIDTTKIKFEYDSDKKFRIYSNGIHINKLNFSNGTVNLHWNMNNGIF